MTLKRLIFILSVLILSSSCNEYSKLLKNDDYQAKYDAAKNYFEQEDYYKTFTLLDQVMPVYNGTKKGESIYWMMAWCDYHLMDYSLAATRFGIFHKRYPLSEFAQEALFMKAMSAYKNSPQSSLDQSETKNAMQDLQLFIDKYPRSERVDSCNKVMDQLRAKLEEKSYNQAYLYLHTYKYKSAIIAFDNLLEDYPDTKRVEQILFYRLKSAYFLAENSVLSKKLTRNKDVLNSYIKFVDRFPSSKFLREAESFRDKAQNYIQKNS